VFRITKTYKEFIEETQMEEYEQCKIIKEILEKYCKDDYAGAISIKVSEESNEEGEQLPEGAVIKL
jgi:hypothetical protein